MEIESEFDVPAAPSTVYATLLDLERIGPCIPGASIGPSDSEGNHPAEIAVRLGPMRLTYRGSVRIAERDADSGAATLIADVREVRGQGSAHALMSMTVSERSGSAHVGARTTVELSGRAAQMGAGIVEDVAGRLVADMASRLEAMLAEPEPAPTAAGPAAAAGPAERPAAGEGASAKAAPVPPIGGIRLLLRALWHRVRRGAGASASRERGGG
jgi:carbon monoxide dehydrogenase subunit G